MKPTPTINVNLTPNRCECPGRFLAVPLREQDHRTDCPASPILIPCPIQRSVAMVVCGVKYAVAIGGNTWATSHVEDVDAYHDVGTAAPTQSVINECNTRWDTIRAILYAAPEFSRPGGWFSLDGRMALFASRDAVFSAVCAMARNEREQREVQDRLRTLDLPSGDRCKDMGDMGEARDSRAALALERYVTMLIEQVGVGP